MARTLGICLLTALFFAPHALAEEPPARLLMPGVTYSKRVQFTPHGPVVLNVITAPKPGGLYSLQPVLSGEQIIGREKVTDMEKRLSATATVAGVNGDLFSSSDGHPSGVLIRGGVLDHPPLNDRTSIGIDADGLLRLDTVSMLGYWRGTGQRLRVTLNDPPSTNGYSLFTRAYGPATPALASGAEVVLRPFPKVTPNTDLVGKVASLLSPSTGRTAIPADGAVLQASGSAAIRLVSDAQPDTDVSVRFTLNPAWDGVVGALGGGPLIVKGGTPVFRANESFTPAQLAPHNPRTAIGQRADGKLLLVAVDGRQPGYSAGVTNFELALAMMQLGALSASALGTGDSTTMAFDGRLLNRPSAKTEQTVAEALLVSYGGVYVPPVSAPVLSPNEDGVAEEQSLSYKLVRPSTVDATLVGPGNVTIQIDSGRRSPGVYRFPWSGDGRREGTWRFVVDAKDASDQESTADRTFTLNKTLSSLRVTPSVLRLRQKDARLVATFSVEHPAKIVATIETRRGVVLRVLARRTASEGTERLTWNGRVGGGQIAYAGHYLLHVTATNSLGRVDLHAAFKARR